MLQKAVIFHRIEIYLLIIFKTHKMKSKLKKVGTLLLALAFSGEVAAQTKDASQNPNIESNIRDFLKGLNSGTGNSIEQ